MKFSWRYLSFCGAFLLTSCSSTAYIQSSPSGAEVYKNGALIGTTPTAVTDMNIMMAETSLSIRKDGYKDGFVVIKKDDFKLGPTIGGFFVMVPWLWMFGYPETPYAVKLEPKEAQKSDAAEKKPGT